MKCIIDPTGVLVIKIHGDRELITEEDEAALLALLLDRAGGIHNLALDDLMLQERLQAGHAT